MFVIYADSLDEAYYSARRLLDDIGVEEDSRNGAVLVAPAPVTTCFLNPTDRVLLTPGRKSNHAFHINEAIWMLSGSNDATWLDQFIHDFSKRYANDDGTMDGAYGYRWRNHFERQYLAGVARLDQLEQIVEILKTDPTSRRAVIAMHDPAVDLNVKTLDQPCNTHIYFRVNQKTLDMTVCCRSNDIIWGAYGANAVHFSVLQEYIAACLNIPVGVMYQVSNNWHAYSSVVKTNPTPLNFDKWPGYSPYLLVEQPSFFIGDCERWVSDDWYREVYVNEWFTKVLYPIRRTHGLCKEKLFIQAKTMCTTIEDFKWRIGMEQWVSDKEAAYVRAAG